MVNLLIALLGEKTETVLRLPSSAAGGYTRPSLVLTISTTERLFVATIQEAFSLATRHLQEGRAGDAAVVYGLIALADPLNVDAAFALAQIRVRAGDASGADAAFRRCIVVSPDAGQVWRRFGQAAMNAERLALAQTALQRALRLNPGDFDARTDAARLMEALRVWDVAAVHLAAINAVRPAADVALRLATARRNAGAPAAEIDRAALDAAATDDDGAAAAALHLAGLNARDAGDAARADGYFRRALTRAPHHSAARFHGGLTRMLLGETTASAFADGEPWAAAHADRADLLVGQGRLKDACSHYLEATLHAPAAARGRDGLAATLETRRRLCRYGEMADKAHTDEWGNIALFDAMEKYNKAVFADPHLTGVARPGGFRRPKVFDCFTFYNELDLLELRLEELDGVVDVFVLAEAAWTFQGVPKPLIFAENKARFARFADKIVHVVVDDPAAGPSPWDRESAQRNAVMNGLAGRAAPDDVVFIGDVDEFPRRGIVAAMRENPAWAGRLNRLSADYYCGYLDFKCNYKWHKQISLPYKLLQAMGPDHARFMAIAKYGNLLYDAGWHFSWLGGIEKVVGKLKAYAHSEYTGLAQMDRNALAAAVRSGGGIFALMDGGHGYGGEFSVVPLDAGFPETVQRDPNRYRAMEWMF